MKGETLTTLEVSRRRALANGAFKSVGGEHQMIAHVTRFIPKGRLYVLSTIERAYRNGDPDAALWWNTYMDLMPVDRDKVDLDAVCEAAGVAPDRLMGIVVSTAMRMGADMADLVAAASQPQVVQKTVESALRISGKHAAIAQKDREFLFQHHKFIPVARGGSVFVSNTANAQAAAAAAQNQPSVPTFRESLQGAGDAYKAVRGELVGEAEE